MFEYGITFERPLFLLLLAAAPVMWVLSFRTLAGLGTYRRIFALLLRTVVFVLLVAEIAVSYYREVHN